ncbi:MAG: YHS domain-containing protein [Endomicrobiaceae bacterium]|nr:YHS domain-containing protein [Endomicrobiaceae bacterium]
MKKLYIIFAVLFFAVLLNNQVIYGEDAPVATNAVTAEVTKPVDVGNTICPVTGNKIDESTKAKYEYEGKIYNFCCPMCINTFKSNPQKYIKKIENQKQIKSKKQIHKTKKMNK